MSIIFNAKKDQKFVHFIGIGGIGVSALARWFLAQKWSVFGSDLTMSKILRGLKNDGIKVKIGHKKTNLGPKIALVVRSQAILPDNPEVLEAKRRNVLILSYPEAICEVARNYEMTAVSGAHGKSTTTAILSLILMRAGFDPTVIVGTKVPGLKNKNFRAGKSKYLILEADEFHSSFLHYSPTLAIITNIDREHLDWYKNFSNIKKAFLKFIGNIKPNGILVANRDDKNLFMLKGHMEKICKRNKIRLVWYSFKSKNAEFVKKVVKIPGRHNISNALAAYTLARGLNISKHDILRGISNYHGAWRRMELKGQLEIKNLKLKIDIYDDYAHHPTEIKATLLAFKDAYPHAKIICVFQPHQAERLRRLFHDFIKSFGSADFLILLPAYKVAGRDNAHKRHSSKNLAEVIKSSKKSPTVFYSNDPENIVKKVLKIVRSNTDSSENYIVVMMGAGNIFEYTKTLMRNLKFYVK